MATKKVAIKKNAGTIVKRVKPNDTVVVEWTESSKHHKAGETSILHRVQAEKMIAAEKAKLPKKQAEEEAAEEEED